MAPELERDARAHLEVLADAVGQTNVLADSEQVAGNGLELGRDVVELARDSIN